MKRIERWVDRVHLAIGVSESAVRVPTDWDRRRISIEAAS